MLEAATAKRVAPKPAAAEVAAAPAEARLSKKERKAQKLAEKQAKVQQKLNPAPAPEPVLSAEQCAALDALLTQFLARAHECSQDVWQKVLWTFHRRLGVAGLGYVRAVIDTLLSLQPTAAAAPSSSASSSALGGEQPLPSVARAVAPGAQWRGASPLAVKIFNMTMEAAACAQNRSVLLHYWNRTSCVVLGRRAAHHILCPIHCQRRDE